VQYVYIRFERIDGIDLWLKWYGIKSKTNKLCCDNDCEMDKVADNLVCSLIKESQSNFQ